MEPIELGTKRLLLRPFSLNDIDDLIEYANSPGWERYLVNVPYPYTRQVAEKFLAMFLDTANWQQQGILANFAIQLEGKVVGEVYLNQQKYDRENERAEIGYSLSSLHWNKGLTTEAARAVVNWAFQTYSFNRLYATCDPRNVGSWRVMEKLGMKREGWLRNHVVWNDEVRDQLYYGILREEWRFNPP
ncbi:MAG: GNAT family N-acetyltransferase [Chloroflexi bacterium]|nr:GNAT family N-acetyltransferase [Chloroflexota bacterium]